MHVEVIVVGAGISGLSAVKWLKESGVSVLVLEAMNRVGGRTLTKRDPHVGYVDLGGSYVGPTQNHLLRLTKELGIETYKVYHEQKEVYYRSGQRLLHDVAVNAYERNPFVNMDINHIRRLIDKMGEEIPANAPWDAPHAEEWDLMSVKDFLKKHCWTKGAVQFYGDFCNTYAASEQYEISLLMFLWYIKQAGGMKRVLHVTNGAEERKFHGGSQQICEKLAAKLEGNVIIDAPVVSINQTKDNVVVSTLNGVEFVANYVILACPPAVQQKIHFTPPLPPIRNQLMQRMPMGTVMKVVLYYKTPFWREKGLSGICTILDDGDEHPLSNSMDDTKPDGSFPAIVGLIAGDKCRKVLYMTPDQRKNLIARSLAKVLDCPEAAEPIHYEEKNWMEEQYVGGCYTALLPPGFLTRYGRALRAPIDRLHFAGTETSIKWSGYMNGAVEAGERAAREIFCRMEKINPDKISISEPDSEDVPALPFEDTFMEKHMPSVPGFLKFVTFTAVLGAATLVFLKYPSVLGGKRF